MGKTWSNRHPKKPRKPTKPPKYKGFTLAALLLLAFAPALASPRSGDMALGLTAGTSDAIGGEQRGFAGASFEMWADPNTSFQGSLSSTADYDFTLTSVSAWHLPFARQAGFFGNAGIAWPSGRGVNADVGVGLEFFPGKWALQFRGDYLYAFMDQGDDGRGAASASAAARWRW